MPDTQKMAAHKRVLVVEDDGLVADVIGMMLTELGYDVVGTAMDGLVALELAEALRPDIVIMDLVMPGIGGLAAARRIQAIHPTPVVLLTAYESPELTPAVIDAGVVTSLEKPVTARDLGRAVAEALAHVPSS